MGNAAKAKLKCCTGETEASDCHWYLGAGRGKYYPRTPLCDAFVRDQCRRLCGADKPDESCSDPRCGCVMSPLGDAGRPQCFDTRCADVAAAYRPAGGERGADACKGLAPSCEEWRLLGNGRFLAHDAPAPVGCAPRPPPGRPRRPPGPPGGPGGPGGPGEGPGEGPEGKKLGPWALLGLVLLVVAAVFLSVFSFGWVTGAHPRPPPRNVPPLPQP